MPPSGNTLWDRTEKFLKDQPWAVFLLLSFIVLGGVKDLVETASAIHRTYNEIWPDQSKLSRILSCAQLGHVQSVPSSGDNAITLYVINTADPTPISVRWIDTTGKVDPNDMGVPVSKGLQSIPIRTFPHHDLVISDVDHACLGILQLGTSSVDLDASFPDGKPVLRYPRTDDSTQHPPPS